MSDGDGGAELIDAAEACRRLGVKRPTLYTYVSRGKIGRVPGPGRTNLYAARDVDRLAAMSAARRGHAAVASGALRWGEPVLDSAITRIDGGLAYRGRSVVALIADGATFEEVAERLWEAEPGAWPAAPAPSPALDGPPLHRMMAALPAIALDDAGRHVSSRRREHERGRSLLRALTAAVTARAAPADRRIAALLADRFGAPRDAPLLDAALIACADHELNVSAFCARVAASAGADLYACVGAALYAFSGPRHGAAGDRIEALLEACLAGDLADELDGRLARGEAIPGFGHRLYPDGDPRTPPLLERVRARRRLSRRARVLLAIVERVEGRTGLRPTVDLGLVAVAEAIGAGPGAGAALFGLGRVAGWIAHALEQRASPAMLRPRARYVGP